MATIEANPDLGARIVDDAKEYVLYSWSTQDAINPIAVAGAEGRHFWDYDGKRYLDFASQLVNVNIGHQHPKIIAAIKEQADRLCTIGPPMASESRSRLGKLLEEVTPGDLCMSFFTNSGAEANENAIKLARLATGRHKIIARYRSYHGATHGSIMLTGDPRRWPNEPGIGGVVHVLDPYHGPGRPVDDAETALRYLEETIELEGPATIAAFFLETVTGTNGILIPPEGYLQGVRELCDRYGILMVADEIMAGFGRTGEWFAIDHWGVVPDLITVAKGLTSSYLPLGAVGIRPHIADHFTDNVFWGGLTYNSHPMSVAAAIAVIDVMRSDDLVGNAKRMGEILRGHHERMAERHPSVGLHRNLGLFGVLELVKSRETMEPLSPFNATNEVMGKLNRFLLDNGVYTMIRWNHVMTNPPLCINEEELGEGFDVMDKALEIADQAMET